MSRSTVYKCDICEQKDVQPNMFYGIKFTSSSNAFCFDTPQESGKHICANCMSQIIVNLEKVERKKYGQP